MPGRAAGDNDNAQTLTEAPFCLPGLAGAGAEPVKPCFYCEQKPHSQLWRQILAHPAGVSGSSGLRCEARLAGCAQLVYWPPGPAGKRHPQNPDTEQLGAAGKSSNRKEKAEGICRAIPALSRPEVALASAS